MSYQNAAEELKALGNKFKAIVSVGEFLEKVGSLDQAAKDAETRKKLAYEAEEIAKAKQVEAEKSLDEANKKISDVKAKGDELIDLSNKKALDLIEAAKKKADVIIAEAKAKDAKAVEALSDSQKKVADMASEVASKNDELKSLQKQIDELKSKIAAFVK